MFLFVSAPPPLLVVHIVVQPPCMRYGYVVAAWAVLSENNIVRTEPTPGKRNRGNKSDTSVHVGMASASGDDEDASRKAVMRVVQLWLTRLQIVSGIVRMLRAKFTRIHALIPRRVDHFLRVDRHYPALVCDWADPSECAGHVDVASDNAAAACKLSGSPHIPRVRR